MTDRKFPVSSDARPLASRSEAGAVDAFVRTARALAPMADGKRGRLILAIDATMSRQPTWDLACTLQGGMFDAAAKSGGLEIQLVYFRGIGECRASRFTRDSVSLKALMSGIDCRGGHTQIGKVLSHAVTETGREKVNAVVFIGDAMEESADDLAEKAGQLALLGVPAFIFQEGNDPGAEAVFRDLARLTRGAFFRFNRQSAAELEKLLRAVSVYASGGLKALEARDAPEHRLMLQHLRARP